MVSKPTTKPCNTLQSPHLTVMEGHASAAKAMIKTLEKYCNNDRFQMFWELTLLHKKNLDVEEPSLLRKQKATNRN